jgi:two-component system LytT family response regulator
MLNAILIDDEAHVRLDVRQKLEALFPNEIHILTEAESVSSAVSAIEKHKPDLVFLDIDIKEGTGFDVLTSCTFKNFEVIFITGFNDQAIKAIKAGALDYILKPVDEEELNEAVQRAIENSKKENQLEKLIQISSDYFKGTEKKRIILKTSEMVHAVYEDDIIYCESDGNYTTFHTIQNENIIITKSLKHAEEILSSLLFIRCHRSYIVNKNQVLKYDKNGFLFLKNEHKVPVSSRRKDSTLQQIF